MNLPKELRLSSKDLLLLKTEPLSKSTNSLLFRVKFYKRPVIKFAIIVGKRFINKSSGRNALKRRIKFALFKEFKEGKLLEGYYVIILKSNFSLVQDYEKISSEINKVLSKIS